MCGRTGSRGRAGRRGGCPHRGTPRRHARGQSLGRVSRVWPREPAATPPGLRTARHRAPRRDANRADTGRAGRCAAPPGPRRPGRAGRGHVLLAGPPGHRRCSRRRERRHAAARRGAACPGALDAGSRSWSAPDDGQVAGQPPLPRGPGARRLAGTRPRARRSWRRRRGGAPRLRGRRPRARRGLRRRRAGSARPGGCPRTARGGGATGLRRATRGAPRRVGTAMGEL